MRSLAAGWLGFLAGLAGLAGVARTSDPVRPGERATFSLPAGDEEIVDVEVAAGAWIVVVESSEFDVLTGLAGGTGVEDHDRGPGLGERVSLDADRPTRFQLRVQAAAGRGGEFTVAVAAQDPWLGVTPAGEIDALLAHTTRADELAAKLVPALVRAFRASLEWRDLASAARALVRLGELTSTPSERRSVDVLRAIHALAEDPVAPAPMTVLVGARASGEVLPGNTDLDGRLVLARCAVHTGKLDEALELVQEVRELAAERGDGFHAARAALESAHVLAMTPRDAEFAPTADEIAEAYDAAVAAVDRAGESTPWLSASVRYAAGNYHWDRGRWARARLAAEPAPLAEVPPHLALRLQALLCDLEVREHDFVAAEQRIEIIGVLLERAGFSLDEVGRIEDLAFTFFSLGRYAESRRLVEQVLEITREIGGLVRAEALITRSALLEVEGQLDLAQDVATESLAILQEASGARPADVEYARAANRINRGRLRRKLGRLAEAEQDFAAALEIAERKTFGNIGLAASHGLAETHFERGEYDEALRFIEPVVAKYRGISDRDALLSALDTLGRIELARGEPDRVRRVLDESERTLENADALDAWGAAGVRSRYADLARLAQDWVAYRLEAADADDRRAAITADGYARAGEWKARALLARLQAHDDRPAARSASTQNRIAPLLGPHRVLLEYAAGRDRLYAYRLSSDGLAFFDLGLRAPIERAILEYRDQVLVRAELLDPAAVVARAHDLYQALLAPLLGTDLPEQLVVVPEGILGTLPFEALVVRRQPEGAAVRLEVAEFVTDRCEVSYAPSSPVLAEQMSRDPRSLASGRGLFLGDAVFPVEAGAPPGEFAGLIRLEQTRSECIRIADLMLPGDEEGGRARRDELGLRGLLSRRTPAPLADPRFDLFLGSEARPSRVLESSVQDYTLLHLATHGHVDRIDPTRSGLVLSSDPGGDRVLDVARIRGLRGLDALVVLSACETAEGPVLRGEGVQSIGSAFLETGARGVVASLWPVEDALARELMERFYKSVLVHGQDPAAALDDARRALRHKPGVVRGLRVRDPQAPELRYAHPSIWAPFVYWGRVDPK